MRLDTQCGFYGPCNQNTSHSYWGQVNNVYLRGLTLLVLSKPEIMETWTDPFFTPDGTECHRERLVRYDITLLFENKNRRYDYEK